MHVTLSGKCTYPGEQVRAGFRIEIKDGGYMSTRYQQDVPRSDRLAIEKRDVFVIFRPRRSSIRRWRACTTTRRRPTAPMFDWQRRMALPQRPSSWPSTRAGLAHSGPLNGPVV